jgi:hypothetical protein
MSKDSKQPKKKKEKIIYVDDGSTIADMSEVGRKPVRPAAQPSYKTPKHEPATRAGRIWQTYKDAVRAMIGPMLVTLGGVSVIFLIIWIILGFFA